MQVADLFRPPLGVLSVKCPSRANQASGLAGGFDYWLSALGYGYDSVINAYGTQSESVHPHLLGKGWDLTVYGGWGKHGHLFLNHRCKWDFLGIAKSCGVLIAQKCIPLHRSITLLGTHCL